MIWVVDSGGPTQVMYTAFRFLVCMRDEPLGSRRRMSFTQRLQPRFETEWDLDDGGHVHTYTRYILGLKSLSI